jgi:hypothetical protein
MLEAPFASLVRFPPFASDDHCTIEDYTMLNDDGWV